MKHLRYYIVAAAMITAATTLQAQKATAKTETAKAKTEMTEAKAEMTEANADSAAMAGMNGETAEAKADSAASVMIDDEEILEPEETQGLHKQLKSKFIEGSAGFMSLVALALVIGLAFCIERIIYLTMSEINAKKFMREVAEKVESDDIEGAKELCRNTRGPVASICFQGLLRISESLQDIERSIVSYGAVQTANLERGCSWIKLCIQIAPSLGFLGTVIGMVMAFDNIRIEGDISATIVASGMKVALITTIFGIIVALVLQLFYNYVNSKIEHITSQMEESAITLLDSLTKYKQR
ncbi:MAG: MotA/TolQ/ExbB proton channel family protein [Prevotella sp.]|nr:MotA/TolQ/ExbB proton channel family protein [Prevotella sp.]